MSDFQDTLAACEDFVKDYPSHVFIGGIAVYLHSVNSAKTRGFAESSHDADLMISVSDLGVMRDHEEVVKNTRLSKYQVAKKEVDFDVYVGRQHGLAVSYQDAFAEAVMYDDIRVACLEHLLVLKLNAMIDRRNSAKGRKDERDVVNLGRLMESHLRANTLKKYFREKHLNTLIEVEEGSVFTTMAEGNLHKAKMLRSSFHVFVKKVWNL